MKILVVEDHTLVCEMLGVVCRQAFPDMEVHQAYNGAMALAQTSALKPEIILLDVALPDVDGLDLLPQLFAASRNSKVIALSSYVDEFTVHRALHSRVHGFMDKNEQPVKILAEAIQSVLAGQRYLSSAVQRARANLRSDPVAFDKVLTDREQALLGIIGTGISNEEIADQLKISAVTVRNHRSKIMAKLGIHTSNALVRYAAEKGFTRARPGEAVHRFITSQA